MLIFWVSLIPCIGLLFLLFWAFSNSNTTRRDYSRAMIVFQAVFFVLYMGLLSSGVKIAKALDYERQLAQEVSNWFKTNSN